MAWAHCAHGLIWAIRGAGVMHLHNSCPPRLSLFHANGRPAVAAAQSQAQAGKRCLAFDSLLPPTCHSTFSGWSDQVTAFDYVGICDKFST